ncbi:MAG: hypothetical protein ACE14S_12095 [Candidatus Bathyarchaeia archaeon]
MRLLRDKKGQIRTIEAFFAAVLLLSSLTIIPAVQRTPNDTAASGTLSPMASNVLASLDSNGRLGDLIDNSDWMTLRSSIQACVPPTVWFNVSVFDENMTILNTELICNGGTVNDKVEVAEYVCASTSANYAVYIVRLQFAAVD